MTMMGNTTVKACPHCNQWLRFDLYVSFNFSGSDIWTDGYRLGPSNTPLLKCPTCCKAFRIKEAKNAGEFNPFDMCDLERDPNSMKDNNPEYWERLHRDEKKLNRQIKLYKDSIDTEDASDSDYLAFIASKKFSVKKERKLRMLSWQAANYGKRHSTYDIPISCQICRNKYVEGKCPLKEVVQKAFSVEFSQEQLENIEILSNLMNEDDPNERILKAEMARERGIFDETTRLLDYPFIEKLYEMPEEMLPHNHEWMKQLIEDHTAALKIICELKVSCVTKITDTLKWESRHYKCFSPSEHPTSVNPI